MAKRVPPLTAAAVAKIKPDPLRTLEFVDGDVPGLRLRVTPKGKLPEGAEVKFMVKRSSKAMEFYSEYHQVSLARTKLSWVSAD